MISLMLQSCGTATNVGIQTWKGKERLASVLLVPKRRLWERSAVLVVIGLVYQQSESKLKDPIDSKGNIINLPEHLQCQSQKPGIAFFCLTQSCESVIPEMITAMRAMIEPSFPPRFPAPDPPGSLMTAHSSTHEIIKRPQQSLCHFKG